MAFRITLIILLYSCSFSCISEKHGSNTSSFLSSNSYPIRLNTKNAYRFSSLSINYQNIRMNFSTGNMIPIECEDGITGVIILASGTIQHFNNTTFQNRTFVISPNIIFRFHPEHFSQIFAQQKIESTNLSNMEEQTWHILNKHFNFAYSNGMEATIPYLGSYGVICNQISIIFDAKFSDNIVSKPKD